MAEHQSPDGKGFRYTAFISYRHVEPDRKWASWLHTSLETYRVPARLVKERGLAPRLGRVFRDEEELAASSNLSEELSTALKQSRFLIVICSRQTPASQWVDEEVRRFIAMGRQDRILTLLVDGEPDEAFPRSLRAVRQGTDGVELPGVEPLAADVRPIAGHGGGFGDGHARTNAKLRLIAALLGLRYDDLRQRERTRQQRRRMLTAIAVILVVALGVVMAVIVRSNMATRGEAELQSRLQFLLEADDWSGAKLDEMDAIVAKVRASSPAKADEARQRVYARYAERLTAQIRQPRLEPTDVERIRAGLSMLAARSPQPGAAAPLQKALSERLADWELVAELKPPFANLRDLLPGGAQPAEGGRLLNVGTAGTDPNFIPVTSTRIPLSASVRMELDYSRPTASTTPCMGVSMGLDASRRHVPRIGEQASAGYCVLIEHGYVDLRQGATVLVHSTLTPVPSQEKSPLSTLTITKTAQRFMIQIDDQPALIFEDLFPPKAGPDAVIGIIGSEVAVAKLRVWRQQTPVAASPMEKGDALFAGGDFAGALAEYRLQIPTAEGPTRRETAFKAAVCLASLAQTAEATREFEQLLVSGSDHWAGLAGMQLAQLLLQQERADELDSVIANLTARFAGQSLADRIPESTKAGLRNYCQNGSVGLRTAGAFELLDFDETQLERRRQGIKLARLIGAGGYNNASAAIGLIRGYDRLGRFQEGIDFGKSTSDGRKLIAGIEVNVLESYLWILRRAGKLPQAKEYIRNRMQDAALVPNPVWQNVLLIELARIEAAEGKWDEAERHIESFFSNSTYLRSNDDTSNGDYDHWSSACLLRGFIRLRRGDEAGAQAAWRAGVLRVDGKGAANGIGKGMNSIGSGSTLLNGCMLGGLTGEWGEPEGQFVLSRGIGSSSDDSGDSTTAARGVGMVLPVQSVYRCWRTPRGREVARRCALREYAMHECVSQPAALIAEDVFRNGTPPIDEKQEAAYWDAANQAIAGYSSRKLGQENMLNLAAAWKGVTGFLGWGAVDAKLKASPELRGRIAYILGRRYLSLKKPGEAATFFRTTVADLGADHPTAKLAAEELSRLAPTASQTSTAK